MVTNLKLALPIKNYLMVIKPYYSSMVNVRGSFSDAPHTLIPDLSPCRLDQLVSRVQSCTSLTIVPLDTINVCAQFSSTVLLVLTKPFQLSLSNNLHVIALMSPCLLSICKRSHYHVFSHGHTSYCHLSPPLSKHLSILFNIPIQ